MRKKQPVGRDPTRERPVLSGTRAATVPRPRQELGPSAMTAIPARDLSPIPEDHAVAVSSEPFNVVVSRSGDPTVEFRLEDNAGGGPKVEERLPQALDYARYDLARQMIDLQIFRRTHEFGKHPPGHQIPVDVRADLN